MGAHQPVTTLQSPAPQALRCSAHSRHNNGAQCKKYAIQGATVCRFHGGAAPQVKLKAAQRLALLIDPSLEIVANRIKEGLDAQETKFFQKDGVVTDSRDVIAWSERREYAALAMAALGIARPKDAGDSSEPAAIQVNITVLGS